MRAATLVLPLHCGHRTSDSEIEATDLAIIEKLAADAFANDVTVFQQIYAIDDAQRR